MPWPIAPGSLVFITRAVGICLGRLNLRLAGRHVFGTGELFELHQLCARRSRAGSGQLKLGTQMAVVHVKQRIAGLHMRSDPLDRYVNLDAPRLKAPIQRQYFVTPARGCPSPRSNAQTGVRGGVRGGSRSRDRLRMRVDVFRRQRAASARPSSARAITGNSSCHSLVSLPVRWSRVVRGVLRWISTRSISAVAHVNDALTVMQNAVVVSHDDDGAVGFHRDLAEQFHHRRPAWRPAPRSAHRRPATAACAQAPGRSPRAVAVRRRVARERHSPGLRVRHVPGPHALPGARLAAGYAGDQERQAGVLGRGQGRQQVVLLEDEAEIASAEIDEIVVVAASTGRFPARAPIPPRDRAGRRESKSTSSCRSPTGRPAA